MNAVYLAFPENFFPASPKWPEAGEQTGSHASLPVQFNHPQGKHEFVNDVASLWELSNEEEIHHFKNESLGMAFLHLCHLALRLGVPLEKVAKKIRYLQMGQRHCVDGWQHLGMVGPRQTFHAAMTSFIQQTFIEYLLLYAGISSGY